VLDTSAVIAHFLDEPGAGAVEDLLAQGPSAVALAAPSWVELATRLRELVPDEEKREEVFTHYTRTLCAHLPVDEAAAAEAVRLRALTPARLPLADALIAGCAVAAGLVLVHRDAHYDAVAGLQVLRLPDR
jgi:predicted nucleic acid-binding protein